MTDFTPTLPSCHQYQNESTSQRNLRNETIASFAFGTTLEHRNGDQSSPSRPRRKRDRKEEIVALLQTVLDLVTEDDFDVSL